MGVKVAVQNDTRSGTRSGFIDHPEAAGFNVVDGCLVLWKKKGRNDEPPYVAYGAGHWISAVIDTEVEATAV